MTTRYEIEHDKRQLSETYQSSASALIAARTMAKEKAGLRVESIFEVFRSTPNGRKVIGIYKSRKTGALTAWVD